MAATASTVLRATPSGGGSLGGGPLGAGAARLMALTGWRRRLSAVLLGVLATAALPPLGALPVLLIAIPGLIWLLDGSASRKAAFGAGWWWGLGWYATGLYWIANAMLIEPDRFGWMIPFATLGLGGVLAVFVGAATALAWSARLGGAGRVMVLAACWTLTEWLRSWVLTGFPWNPLGSVWDAVPAVLQTASVFGVFGLCLLTVLVFGLPAMLADMAPRRSKIAALAAAALLLAITAGAGGWRLATLPTEVQPGIRLRLVQASIGQSHKWRDDLREAHLQEQLTLSRAPAAEPVTHVIWPETAAPFFLDLDEGHRAMVASAAPAGGMVLTGAPRVTPQGVEPFRLWNSLLAIDGAGRVLDVYDKVHLVPFGEYVPFRRVLPIDKITHGATDFSSGPHLRTLALPGLPPVSPLICYEAIFPAAVVGTDQARPRWLINLTNDGWFGISAGPYQHFAAARMRAVEEGLPLVRVANTGISAVTDGYGRVIARLGLGERGVVDTPLPKPPPGLTPYARWGNLIALLLAVLVGALGWALRRLP